jgi:hypothetical protein
LGLIGKKILNEVLAEPGATSEFHVEYPQVASVIDVSYEVGFFNRPEFVDVLVGCELSDKEFEVELFFAGGHLVKMHPVVQMEVLVQVVLLLGIGVFIGRVYAQVFTVELIGFE